MCIWDILRYFVFFWFSLEFFFDELESNYFEYFLYVLILKLKFNFLLGNWIFFFYVC